MTSSNTPTIALSLSCWGDVSGRILPRVRPADGAGPLARPFGRRLAIDLAVSVVDVVQPPPPEGADPLVAVDDHMLAGWGVGRGEAASAAIANLAGLETAAPTVPWPDLPGLRLLVGSVWVTGLVADLDLLVQRTRQPNDIAPPSEVAVGIASESAVLVAVDRDSRSDLAATTGLVGRLASDPLAPTVAVIRRQYSPKQLRFGPFR